MKPNDTLNDREAVRNRRIKRTGLAVLASYLPTLAILGIMFEWDFGQWMVAWTGVSMATFLTIATLFGVVKCPMERRKGNPRPKKGQRK